MGIAGRQEADPYAVEGPVKPTTPARYVNHATLMSSLKYLILVSVLCTANATQAPIPPIFSPCNFPTPISGLTFHRSVCNNIPKLPFICDLQHQLAYMNTGGIERAFKRYEHVFINGNKTTIGIILAKQLDSPASTSDVLKSPDYACLFNSDCNQMDSEVIVGIVTNVKTFLKVYAWKVYERWFGPIDSCGKTNLLAVIVMDGLINDVRKIPHVRIHTGADQLRHQLVNIQTEVNNALVQGWPLTKVIEDMVDDLGYALKEYYELNGENRDHSVPMWARHVFLICLLLVIMALVIEWYIVRRKLGVQKSGSIKIASGKSKTHLMF